MSKYRNKKIEFDGQKFDSLKEFHRWQDLKILEKAGVIEGLDRQKRYRIEVAGVHICDYVADHVYTEKGRLIVEDVKSAFTRKLPVYRIKKKLMKANFGIEILEV